MISDIRVTVLWSYHPWVVGFSYREGIWRSWYHQSITCRRSPVFFWIVSNVYQICCLDRWYILVISSARAISWIFLIDPIWLIPSEASFRVEPGWMIHGLWCGSDTTSRSIVVICGWDRRLIRWTWYTTANLSIKLLPQFLYFLRLAIETWGVSRADTRTLIDSNFLTKVWIIHCAMMTFNTWTARVPLLLIDSILWCGSKASISGRNRLTWRSNLVVNRSPIMIVRTALARTKSSRFLSARFLVMHWFSLRL